MSTSVNTLFSNVVGALGGLDILKDIPYSQAFGNIASVTTSLAEYNIFNRTFDKDSPLNNLLQSSNKNFSAQFTSTENIKIKNNGLKAYISQSSPTDFIAEYTLSRAYDISTATYVNQINISGTVGNIRDFDISADGTKMIVLGDAAANTIYEYTLSTPYQISSAAYQSRSFSLNSQDTGMIDINLSVSGLRLIALGVTNNKLYQYTLGSAFNLTSVTFNTELAMSSYLTNPTFSIIRGFGRDDTGRRLVVAYTPTGGGGDFLQEIKLSSDGTLSAAIIGLGQKLPQTNLMHYSIAGNYSYINNSAAIVQSLLKSTKSGVLVDSVTFGFTNTYIAQRMWFYGFNNNVNGVQTKPLDDTLGMLIKQMYASFNTDPDPVIIPLGLYATSNLSINAILQSFDAVYSNLRYTVNYRVV